MKLVHIYWGSLVIIGLFNLRFSFLNDILILVILGLLLMTEIFRYRLSKKVVTTEKLLDMQTNEIQQMNETFLIVRKERHDFLKHISSIHYMLESKDYKQATNYLDHLVEGYKETNLSIQGERGAVAGILHQSYQEGKKKDIEIIYDLESPLSSLSLSDTELTAFIGNILGNAIDASEAWQIKTKKQATITLQAYKRSGLFIINCKNHTLPIANDILDQLFEKPGLTTKTGNHEGLGTTIIADIVKQNQGHLDFIYKNEKFTIHIKLPAMQ